MELFSVASAGGLIETPESWLKGEIYGISGCLELPLILFDFRIPLAYRPAYLDITECRVVLCAKSSGSGYLTIEAVTTDQQHAFESNAAALHFHPNISPPILGFDPRVIQDDFDPFNLDLSPLVAFETKINYAQDLPQW
ncbi:hypothetical protein A1O7_09628 [Cladophialophora yegresii CBS 114405]|uniref:Uncharacterized protein n=1 Tax=Cladophialophora yegresii CBS 114405 TaxID=1182544 RepID=W9VMP6_9EURO|nr:uncharacterized protein A1O7_09628 [Cladophialophora yegresii CBS 114405]EXJ54290.1 hypothetical protein A1O7_09628 [Cladophialophora yegresii CBS 114405]